MWCGTQATPSGKTPGNAAIQKDNKEEQYQNDWGFSYHFHIPFYLTSVFAQFGDMDNSTLPFRAGQCTKI